MVFNLKFKQLSLAICLALLPLATGAAGLGKMRVYSALGEPLSAEIELIAISAEELASMTARIAPKEVYADQGLDRPAVLGAIKVELVNNPDAPPVLKLSSQKPVNDPFLDMLIQVEWASGKVLREYTALLDPPSYNTNNAVAENASNQPVFVTDPQQTVKPPSGQPVGKIGKIRKQPSAPVETKPQTGANSNSSTYATAASQKGEESYQVRSGDTLSGIAARTQVEGVSLEQMLVGLYQSNQDAFVGKNMNRLKAGKILRVPDAATLQSISQTEAVKEIRLHTADWNAYRNQLAGTVAQSAPATEAATRQENASKGTITAPAQDKGALPAPGPRDVLKLSKSDQVATKSATPDGKGPGSQDEVNARKEESIAHDLALKEANERVAALEKQIQDMQKLLQLKNQSAPQVQKDTAPAPPPAAEQAAPATVPQAAPTAPPPAAGTAEPSAAPAPPVTTPQPETTAPAPTKPLPPKPLPPKPVAVEPVAEPSMLDTLLGALGDNKLLLGVAGGGLIVLGGAGFLYSRMRRRKSIESVEQSVLKTAGLRPNTVFGNTAGGTVDTGDISFLTDFSQGAGGDMIDTGDVDPIAEAEVYLAYGRDAQAEEILKDAIIKDPTRYELHQKLLEIYAGRNDIGAFEATASELYSTLGADDPHWPKIAELGRKLEPENPMYAVGANESTAKTAAEPAPQPLKAPSQQKSDVVDQAALAMATPVAAVTTAEIANEASLLGFDLVEHDVASAEATAVAASSTSASYPEIDDKTAPSSSSPVMPGTNQAENIDAFDMDFNLSAALAELDEEKIPPPPETSLPTLEIDLPVAAARYAETETNVGLLDFSLPEINADSVSPMLENQAVDIAFDLPYVESDVTSASTEGDVAAVVEPSAGYDPAAALAQELVEREVSQQSAEEPSIDLAGLDSDFPITESGIDTSAEDSSQTEVERAVKAEDVIASTVEPSTGAARESASPSALAHEPDEKDLPEEAAQPPSIDLAGLDSDFPDTESTALPKGDDSEIMTAEPPVIEETALAMPEAVPTEPLPVEKTATPQASPTQAAHETSPEESLAQAGVDDFTVDDFTIDVPVAIEDTPQKDKQDTSPSSPLEINLSGINLNFDEPATPLEAAKPAMAEFAQIIVTEPPAPAVSAPASEVESSDVETKLDLVAAYLDIEDAEGARELLVEVLMEGGPQQRSRAQEILDKLG